MADKDDDQVLTTTCIVQRKFDPIKIEHPEADPTEDSSKRRRSSRGTEGLWRENAVGMAAKGLLEAIHHHYPETFQRVQVRASPIWLTILKHFSSVMKSFMGTSVGSLTEEQVNKLGEDLKEFETFGFDLSWAQKRLDMVDRLKFGKEPLQKELTAVEESLEPLKVRVEWRWKLIMEAHDEWKETQCEYNIAKGARDQIAEQMAQKFGAEYEQVLKGNLGFGMLPLYY